MKISEITLKDVLDYIREDEENVPELPLIMTASKRYICGRTSLSESELDLFEDLTDAYLAVIAQMYDERSGITDGRVKENALVENILSLHDYNLIPLQEKDLKGGESDV